MRIVVLAGYDENYHYNEALLRIGIRGYLSQAGDARRTGDGHTAVHAGDPCLSGPLREMATPQMAGQPSARELDVLHLADAGYSNQKIAARLCLAEPTIRFHLHSLFTKFSVKRRTELVSVARQRGALQARQRSPCPTEVRLRA